jgi:hypothetical protein
MKMAIRVRTAAYLGIAIRMEPPQDGQGGAVAVTLEHRDPGLSLPLYRSSDGTDIVAEWQSWARALCLPLLIVEADGRLREPFARLGAVRVAAPTWRRRRRSAIRARRPTLSLRRRRVHQTAAAPAVYRDEREIIARN